MARYTEQILIKATPQMRAEVERRAAAEGRSLSDAARRLISSGLQQDGQAGAR